MTNKMPNTDALGAYVIPRGRQLPPPIRWWHCLFGHHWTEWRKELATTRALVPHPITGNFGLDKQITVQVRTCTKCKIETTRYWK